MTLTERASPVELGDAVSYAGLTLVPLFARVEPNVDFIALDEALALGLSIEEVGDDGVVESLVVGNDLEHDVLLYEGEDLVGANQNRTFDRPVLVPARTRTHVSVACVERGRWSRRSRRFSSPPHAAYPSLRRAAHARGQAGVWDEVEAKSRRLRVKSPTSAAEALYAGMQPRLEEYVGALGRREGQCGSIVAVAGKVTCLDFISRAGVHARVHEKLLRGYALDAIEVAAAETDVGDGADAFVEEVAGARREPVPTDGRGVLSRLSSSRVIGWELRVGAELVSLTAFPACIGSGALGSDS